jgi:hypothetical protein
MRSHLTKAQSGDSKGEYIQKFFCFHENEFGFKPAEGRQTNTSGTNISPV